METDTIFSEKKLRKNIHLLFKNNMKKFLDDNLILSVVDEGTEFI